MVRGQSSIEFIIIVGALLFFFTVFVFYVQTSLNEKSDHQRDEVLYDIAASVQQEVALAQASSTGYQRTFVLPSTVVHLPYNATLQGQYVYLYTLDNRHALSLPVGNVTGVLIVGSNLIRNVNGSVYVN
jgi:uncharacterized protein (UPF0333 family)